jgi:hypothetical protein
MAVSIATPLSLCFRRRVLAGWSGDFRFFAQALLVIAALAGVFLPRVARAQCHPGDFLIGEDKKFFYCSHKSCPDLDKQLQQDEEALRRLRHSIDGSNAELNQWSKMNSTAEKAALAHATEFLVSSTFGWVSDKFEGKLAALEKDFERRAPMGETWNQKLEKIRKFESSYARLSGIVAGFKIANYPGNDAVATWLELRTRATKLGQEGEVLSSAWRDLDSDPEVKRIIKEHGIDFSLGLLKQGLTENPFVTQTLDLAQFGKDYGYDATAWELSRERIMQNIAGNENSLLAECKLSRQLKITIRDRNICNNKYPDPNLARPESQSCGVAP